MGEIKSTLDLVMEKTKHLTLSDAEKAAQRRQELERNIYGLVRKYQDNLIAKPHVEKEMAALRKTHGVNPDDVFKETLLNGLKPGGNNKPLLELLRDVCHVDTSALERILQNFTEQVAAEAKARIKTIKDELATKHSISGAAVIPNLAADAQWSAMLDQTQATFDKMLSQQKAAV